MDVSYRDLFTAVHRSPESYGLDGSYSQAVAFVLGCDAGNDWSLLLGFREWLATRLGCEANLAWPALVMMAAQVPVKLAGPKKELDESINARLVDTWLVIEGEERIGGLTVWDAGEGQLSMAETSDGTVFEEYRIFGSAQEVMTALAEIGDRVIGR